MTISKTDGGYNRDNKAVIAVDWETVETETDQQYPHELRRIIERVGSTSEVYLDKWGYTDYSTTSLFTAVRDNARINHPDRGPLPRRYITLRGCDVTSALRVEVHDADLNFGNLTTGVEDNLSFVDGLSELVDASEAIDEQCDSWYNHPELRYGSYGPDKFGNCYINVSHTDKEVIEGIDSSDLPVEAESILHWGERPHNDDQEEHYTAVYRHKRYYNEGDETVDEYGKEAAEIGLLGSNLGHQTSITAAFNQEGHEYEEVDSMAVRGQGIAVYEYEKDDEMRYAAEWSKRVKIDEVIFKSLVFDDKPDADAIEQAALIEEARLAEDDA